MSTDTHSSALYGLPRPDRTATVELEDADPKELVQNVYEIFLDSTNGIRDADGIYREACRITAPFADKLVGLFKEKKPFKKNEQKNLSTGLFLSSICNQSSKREIVCNNEMKLRCLAAFLPKDKTFINRGKAYHWMGEHAEGTVINYGETGNEMGYFATGVIINCGETYSWMGSFSESVVANYGKTANYMGNNSKGLVVNCGEAGQTMGDGSQGIVIALKTPTTFGNINLAELLWDKKNRKEIPEVIEYFDGLKAVLDKGKKDYRALSKLPTGQKITEDVEQMLKKRGLLRQ